MDKKELAEDKEVRYSSRKWELVKKTVWLYTGIHLLNAAILIGVMYLEWLPDVMVKDIWLASLTIWSAGVLAVVGWYMKKNVDQKALMNGGK